MRIKIRVLCCALLLAGVCGLFYTVGESRKLFSDGAFYLYPIVNGIGGDFALGEAAPVAAALDMWLVGEKPGSGYFSGNGINTFARIIYTNEDYPRIHKLSLVDGGFLADARALENTAVLSEGLAWRLFGAYQINGLTVRLNGQAYEVVGVVKQTGAEDTAWLYGDTPETLYLVPGSYDPINGYRQIEAFLQLMGKNPMDFGITDLTEYGVSLARRPIWVLSFFGLVVAVFLAIHAYQSFKRIRHRWRSAVLYAAVAVAIMWLLDFAIWIPGFEGGGVAGFFTAVTNLGRLPGDPYLSCNLLRLSRLNFYSNLWLVLCIASLLAVWCSVTPFNNYRLKPVD